MRGSLNASVGQDLSWQDDAARTGPGLPEALTEPGECCFDQFGLF